MTTTDRIRTAVRYAPGYDALVARVRWEYEQPAGTLTDADYRQTSTAVEALATSAGVLWDDAFAAIMDAAGL